MSACQTSLFVVVDIETLRLAENVAQGATEEFLSYGLWTMVLWKYARKEALALPTDAPLAIASRRPTLTAGAASPSGTGTSAHGRYGRYGAR